MLVDIVIESNGWEGLAPLAEAAARATLADAGLNPDGREIALLACDDDRIAALNAEFRGRPAPTNVLSWPATALSPGDVPEAEMGDIAIARGVCAAEAEAQGKTFDAHVTHLIVHAVLHLLGHDHAGDADAALMEGAERRILAAMGLPDPYAGERARGARPERKR